MLSPLDSVSKDTMFSGRTYATVVRSFVHPDRSCYHDISWTAWAISMQLTVNIRLAHANDLIRFGGSEVKNQGHSRPSRCRDIHVDVHLL